MLTMPRRAGHMLFLLPLLMTTLVGCAARQELHEFPPELALPARPAAEVNYSLRMDETVPGRWELLGGQRASIGVFQWQAGVGDDGAAGNVDLQRVDRIIDGVNGTTHELHLGVVNGDLRRSTVVGMAPPRAIVTDAASGERIGQLEVRSSFEQRLEGVWRGLPLLWQVDFLPERRDARDTGDGTIEDVYPAAQLLRWTGGSDAGLTIYAGRQVNAADQTFGAPFFDIAANRPLTRRELGDVVTILFALRGLQQMAGE